MNKTSVSSRNLGIKVELHESYRLKHVGKTAVILLNIGLLH